MLTAVKSNPARRQTARGFSIPAPVGGLNARDPLTAMKPTDAVMLENMFPEANYVALRRGYASHGTGLGSGVVETLMTYHAINGSEKLFGAANHAIYDCTSAGAASSVYSTSITSNRWQWFDFSTTADLFILAFNGSDPPLKYNTASTWTVNAITSASISSVNNLIGGCSHKERVWLIEKNTLNLWYLASGAIAGTATKFPLTGVFTLGGSIMAIGTLSLDAGDGLDDLFVAVTSNGEMAVYSGTSPTSANTWALVGVYRINEPLGYRAMTKFGGDLFVLTTGGVISVQQAMANDRSQQDKVAITAKIQDLFNADARLYRDNFGWQAIVYPKARQSIFNVPVSVGVSQRQWVQNTIQGGWCKFTNMNANCWGILNEELYFGGNGGVVFKADTGYQDGGGAINWDMKTAFQYFGRGRQKFFKMVRPLIVATGAADIAIGINVDFENAAPTGTLSASLSGTGVWGSGSAWSSSLWGGFGFRIQEWNTVGKIGYTAAVRLKGQSNGVAVQVNGFDVIAEMGGLI